MDHSTSPYHLPKSDSLGTMLLSHVIIGENYHTWSRSVHMALKAKNKIGFVNGTIVRSNLTDPSYET